MKRYAIYIIASVTLAACSAPPNASIYLYPGAKVEVTEGGLCAVHENLTSDTLTPVSPDRSTWLEHSTYKDQTDRSLLRVTPCGQ